jgi:CBS-domain-containing membrane protein
MPDLPLKTFRFPENTCIPQAVPKVRDSVTTASPALDVMTDLGKVKAETIDPSTSLASAEQVMINRGVRALFVVSDFPCVDGLVTSADLEGDRAMRVVTERRITHNELTVADVMTPLSMIDSLDYDELKASSVGRVVATFEKLNRRHLVVVQAATRQGPARIRGVVSLTRLERQLGRNVLTVSPSI